MIPMSSYRQELWLTAINRREFINITSQVEQCVAESNVSEGLVLVNAMHNTASVFINDDEAGLLQDLDDWLEQLAPREPTSRYRHNRTGEDNAEAHLKRLLMGREVVVAITGGQLDLGAFEQIFFGDFDGGRPKRVLVKIIGD
jgi:secondary thiamine-phosphate synthase enzyme